MDSSRLLLQAIGRLDGQPDLYPRNYSKRFLRDLVQRGASDKSKTVEVKGNEAYDLIKRRVIEASRQWIGERNVSTSFSTGKPILISIQEIRQTRLFQQYDLRVQNPKSAILTPCRLSPAIE